MMMASKSMKVLNIIAGVLLIVAGIYCLCNQDIAAMTAGVMVGIFMLLSGVIEIVVFATTSGLLFGSGWLLLDGVLTVILSRFVSAFDLRAFGVRGWGWLLTIGIILMVAGFICMMDPWVSVAAIGLTVGLAFLLEGISSIVYACIPRSK